MTPIASDYMATSATKKETERRTSQLALTAAATIMTLSVIMQRLLAL